jgi:hypothetical protein
MLQQRLNQILEDTFLMILFCQETTAVHVPLVIIQIKAFTDGESRFL